MLANVGVMKFRIGQILVADGLVTDEAVVRALDYQKRSTRPFRLGSILLGWDLLGEEGLLAGLAKLHHCASVKWDELSVSRREALRCLPPNRAIKLGAFPYAIEPGRLRVAFSDPSNLLVVDEAAQVAGKVVAPAVTTEVALALAYKKFYGQAISPQLKTIAEKLERRPTMPGTSIPIAQPVETASVATRETTAGQPDWPFWTSEDDQDSPRPVPGERIPWLHAGESPVDDEPAMALGGGEARRRDQIAAPVLEILLAGFPRVVLFGVGKSSIAGWAGRGPGLSREEISEIRVPASGDSVLAEVASSGAPHFGSVEASRLPRALLSDSLQPECAVFPIRVLDSVAGLLYADRMGAPMASEDFAALARGAASAASLLSRFLQTEP
jgi:type II secretion system (T2SS) protein E